MKYAVLYEFKDTKGDKHVEAIISRYNDGYAAGRAPNVVVTAEFNKVSGKYETAEGYDDVEGDGDIDADDGSYYTLAADIASAVAGLSRKDESRHYKCMLVSFKQSDNQIGLPDVKIQLFKTLNLDSEKPETVIAHDYRNSIYNDITNTLDADQSGTIDSKDKTIFKLIANSFASMRDFKA